MQHERRPAKLPHKLTWRKPVDADLGNPLTGRVAANKVWHLFDNDKMGPFPNPVEVPNSNPDLRVPFTTGRQLYGKAKGWRAVWNLDQVIGMAKVPVEYSGHAPSAADQLPAALTADQIMDRNSKLSPTQDNIATARVPINHQSSCTSSHRSHNCLGCGQFWKFVQNVAIEALKPFGERDLLQFDSNAAGTATFHASISTDGAYTPLQSAPLACTTVNTLFTTDDANGAFVWGLISPEDAALLSEDYILGQRMYQNVFFDHEWLESIVKVHWFVQRSGQTIVVPPGWYYFNVYHGKNSYLSAEWNILFAENLLEARKRQEVDRAMYLGPSKRMQVDLSSIVVSCAYFYLDEYRQFSETNNDDRTIDLKATLSSLLPVLKVIVLEELLGERVDTGALPLLAYRAIVEQYKKQGERLPSGLMSELSHSRRLPLPPLKEEVLASRMNGNHSGSQPNNSEMTNNDNNTNNNNNSNTNTESNSNVMAETSNNTAANGTAKSDSTTDMHVDQQASSALPMSEIDGRQVCHHCLQPLFNVMRLCKQCNRSGSHFAMCDSCYDRFGRLLHEHKLTRVRRVDVIPLLDLVDQLVGVVYDAHETDSAIAVVPSTLLLPRRQFFPSAPKLHTNSALSGSLKHITDEQTVEPERLPGTDQLKLVSSGQVTDDVNDNDSISATRSRKSLKRRQMDDEGSDESNENDEIIDCVCGNNKDSGFMISCERCFAWLHGKCVGISRKNEPEVYYCPFCERKMQLNGTVPKRKR